MECYGAFSGGRRPDLPQLPIQYADFAHWQRTWLARDLLESELAYWRGRLLGAPQVLELPTDRPRPPVQTYVGAFQEVEIPLELAEALKALSRREGATLFMTLLSVFQVLLSRTSGQEDLCVGTPIAGRTHLATEALI